MNKRSNTFGRLALNSVPLTAERRWKTCSIQYETRSEVQQPDRSKLSIPRRKNNLRTEMFILTTGGLDAGSQVNELNK